MPRPIRIPAKTPLRARPQSLKWLGLCFGERLGPPCCGLAGRKDVGFGGGQLGERVPVLPHMSCKVHQRPGNAERGIM